MFGYMQTMRTVCNINHRTFFLTISWEASLHLYQHTIAILQTSRSISLKIYNVRETRYNEIFGVRLKFINFRIISLIARFSSYAVAWDQFSHNKVVMSGRRD